MTVSLSSVLWMKKDIVSCCQATATYRSKLNNLCILMLDLEDQAYTIYAFNNHMIILQTKQHIRSFLRRNNTWRVMYPLYKFWMISGLQSFFFLSHHPSIMWIFLQVWHSHLNYNESKHSFLKVLTHLLILITSRQDFTSFPSDQLQDTLIVIWQNTTSLIEQKHNEFLSSKEVHSLDASIYKIK